MYVITNVPIKYISETRFYVGHMFGAKGIVTLYSHVFHRHGYYLKSLNSRCRIYVANVLKYLGAFQAFRILVAVL